MFCHLYCFAAATQGKFFLFQNSNIYVIKIGIRIRDPESESGLQKICTRIRNPNPPIFWPDCHPWKLYTFPKELWYQRVAFELSYECCYTKILKCPHLPPPLYQIWVVIVSCYFFRSWRWLDCICLVMYLEWCIYVCL